MSMKNEMNLPKVAIVGRPNVGKSTLFNLLTRSRKAVVKNEPGVTRDIQMADTEWWGNEFTVIDTGGLTDSEDEFSKLIKTQVKNYISSIDLILLVMDAKSGLVPEDRDVLRIVKASGKPFCLVINKVDKILESDLVLSEFYEFGIELLNASFERQDGVDRIVEWIIDHSKDVELLPEEEKIKLSIVGKPNVGKSSLVNYLAGENRVLVSDIAGTTVDAIDIGFEYRDHNFLITDTAGLRRSSKRKDGVEYISAVKSHSSIDRSDIVLVLIDGLLGPSVQDAKIVEYILSKHKAVILVANKIDVAKQERDEFRMWFREMVENKFHFFKDIPLAFISAKTGSGVTKLFDLVVEIHTKLNTKIKTSKLNDFFFSQIRKAPSPVHGTKNVKFYYLTQTNQKPPSFIAFANYPESVHAAYRRFLSKSIQKEFDLQGIPVRIFCMKSQKKSKSSVAESGVSAGDE